MLYDDGSVMCRTDESIGGSAEQRQRAGRDRNIYLYDEEEEIDRKASVDGEFDLPAILESIFNLCSFFVSTVEVGIDECILAIVVLLDPPSLAIGWQYGLSFIVVFVFSLRCLKREWIFEIHNDFVSVVLRVPIHY